LGEVILTANFLSLLILACGLFLGIVLSWLFSKVKMGKVYAVLESERAVLIERLQGKERYIQELRDKLGVELHKKEKRIDELLEANVRFGKSCAACRLN